MKSHPWWLRAILGLVCFPFLLIGYLGWCFIEMLADVVSKPDDDQ